MLLQPVHCCMCSAYQFSVCVPCISSLYVFMHQLTVCVCASVLCMCSVYQFSICVPCISSLYVFMYQFSVCVYASVLCMCSVYQFSVCVFVSVLCMCSVYQFSVCVYASVLCMCSVYQFSVCVPCISSLYKVHNHDSHRCYLLVGINMSSTTRYIYTNFYRSWQTTNRALYVYAYPYLINLVTP